MFCQALSLSLMHQIAQHIGKQGTIVALSGLPDLSSFSSTLLSTAASHAELFIDPEGLIPSMIALGSRALTVFMSGKHESQAVVDEIMAPNVQVAVDVAVALVNTS